MSTPNPFDQFDSGSAAANPFDQFDNAQPAAPSAPAEAPFTFGGWLKSNVGVPLARSAINATTALPFMAQDLGVAVRDVAGDVADNGLGAAASHLWKGNYQYPYDLPSHVVQQAIQPYLPAPTTTAGRLSEAANSVVMGVGGGIAGVTGMNAPTYGNVPAGFVSSAARNGLTAAQQNAADAGSDLGMRLTPGQQTGSVPLQQFEAKMQSSPWTSGPFARLSQGNQQTLNEAWAGTNGGIGQGGHSVDSTVLQAALDRTGDVFNAARNAGSVVMQDPNVTKNVLDGIDSEFEGLIPGSVRNNPLVARFEKMTGEGAINGEQLGSLSSKLGRVANNQMTSMNGDRELGQALYAVKDHVDDLLQSTLSGDESAAYGAARQQYRAAMQLSARAGNLNPNTGNVSGPNMASYLQTKDKAGYLFGRNQSDAYNATRFAQAFKPIVGDSGTATRSWNWKELPFALPANAFARSYLSGPGSAIARGIAGVPGTLSSGASPSLLSGLQVGLPSAGYSREPVALPYLEE